ncbi:hypothetical protein J8273_3326 [Carpediemonas membranifera]|uniref:Uncharacterized protein n=1 Tax=Carpediemonas membranifera TaxID=201153 RepID=A0A8J6AWB1_9EUKA|nr:hypothetical protein J8273_3326 [Carpediemonas membranifera]|eukprot:KAG9393195.1 hypothetical protein J8273_3326 [Carpediemonas membranifera]
MSGRLKRSAMAFDSQYNTSTPILKRGRDSPRMRAMSPGKGFALKLTDRASVTHARNTEGPVQGKEYPRLDKYTPDLIREKFAQSNLPPLFSLDDVEAILASAETMIRDEEAMKYQRALGDALMSQNEMFVRLTDSKLKQKDLEQDDGYSYFS